MKKLLYFFCLLTTLAQAQNAGFPSLIVSDIDKARIEAEEGADNLYTNGVNASPISSTSATYNMLIMPTYNSNLFTMVKRKTTLNWSSDGPFKMTLPVRDVFGSSYAFIDGWQSKTGNATFESSVSWSNAESVSLYNFTVAGTNIQANVITNYLLMPNGADYTAPSKIVWMGDSRMVGTTNSDVTVDKFYMNIVTNWLTANSVIKTRYRPVIYARGGTQTTNLLTAWNAGQIRASNPTIYFIGYGVNDNGQSIGTTTYESNLRAVIAGIRNRRPNALIVLLTDTPVANATTNANVDAYRDKMLAIVATLADPYVKCIDLRKAYDRTLGYAIWASSDTDVNNAVHPGTPAAQAAIANCLLFGTNYDGTTTTGLQQILQASTVVKFGFDQGAVFWLLLALLGGRVANTPFVSRKRKAFGVRVSRTNTEIVKSTRLQLH